MADFQNNNLIGTKDVNQYLTEIEKSLITGSYNEAAELIASAAYLEYTQNKKSRDVDLEQAVDALSDCFKTASSVKYVSNNGVVILYDGFDADSTGTIIQYVQSLGKLGYKIFYVSFETTYNQNMILEQELAEWHAECILLPQKSIFERCKYLYHYIQMIKPEHIFVYTKSYDIVPAVVLPVMAGTLKRYIISTFGEYFSVFNDGFDYMLEFSNLSACIANEFRNIPEKKILQQPLCFESRQVGFAGYPFPKASSDYVIFSYGSCDRFYDVDNTFLTIAEYILVVYPQVKFWFAVTDCKLAGYQDLLVLRTKYPHRVVITDCRKDVVSILEHVDLYIHNCISWDNFMLQLAEQKQCPQVAYSSYTGVCSRSGVKILYTQLDEMLKAIDRYITDKNFCEQYKLITKDYAITVQDFTQNLQLIMTQGRSKYLIKYENTAIVVRNFRQRSLTKLTDAFHVDMCKLLYKCFAEEHYEACINYANSVPVDSELYAYAIIIKGSAFIMQGNEQAAFKEYEALLKTHANTMNCENIDMLMEIIEGYSVYGLFDKKEFPLIRALLDR